MLLIVEVVVVVVEVTVEGAYWKVVVPVAPVESVADITYVPATHNGEPPTCVAYEKVPEVTASIAESRHRKGTLESHFD